MVLAVQETLHLPVLLKVLTAVQVVGERTGRLAVAVVPVATVMQIQVLKLVVLEDPAPIQVLLVHLLPTPAVAVAVVEDPAVQVVLEVLAEEAPVLVEQDLKQRVVELLIGAAVEAEPGIRVLLVQEVRVSLS
jgi:hypothetical protein